MRKKMIILSTILVAIVLLASISPSIFAKNIDIANLNNNVRIEVNRYNGRNNNQIYSDVSLEEAEEIKQILIQLNKAIETNDEEAILAYEQILNEKGIFGSNYQKFFSQTKFLKMFDATRYSVLSKFLNDDDISNYMCYFNAVGEGTIHFTLGIRILEAIIRIVENASNPIAGLILLLALLPFYALVFLLTHLIPFRIMMPLGIVTVDSGTISSRGTMGYKKITVETEPVNVNISWFTGLTINIGTENAFLFVSGVALEVKESDI